MYLYILKFKNLGSVAQLVEQWIEAPCVGGSIPSRAIIMECHNVLAGVV
ncbi:hypothetical protein LPICM02_10023 [Pseudolactococcus piscium]|nr:hypothetical protein LPICM02_10023 [Lactococcus piscium]